MLFRSMYQMDDSNPAHMIMKYDHSGGTGNGQQVDLMDFTKAMVPADWDMKSPNIKAYTDQSQLETQAPTQYTYFNNWWTIAQTYINSQTSDNWAALEKVLDKDTMIDYVVFSEAVLNTDGVNDNFMFLSWDGLTFVPNIYDLDLTFGNNRTDTPPTLSSPLYLQSDPFWGAVVYNNWMADVKARYKYLRDTGVISIGALVEDSRYYTSIMSKEAKVRAYNAWGGQGGYTVEGPMSFILDWYQARINTLDTALGYTSKNTTWF